MSLQKTASQAQSAAAIAKSSAVGAVTSRFWCHMVGSRLSGSSDLARFSRGCQALQDIPLSPANSTKYRTRCRAACSHAARSIRQPRPACPWSQHRSSPDLLAARHRICGRGVAAIADRRQPRVHSVVPCGLYPAGTVLTTLAAFALVRRHAHAAHSPRTWPHLLQFCACNCMLSILQAYRAQHSRPGRQRPRLRR